MQVISSASPRAQATDSARALTPPAAALRTGRIFPSATDCIAHAAAEYSLDLPKVVGTLRLDLYGRVKLINYVRSTATREGADSAQIVSAVVSALSHGVSEIQASLHPGETHSFRPIDRQQAHPMHVLRTSSHPSA